MRQRECAASTRASTMDDAEVHCRHSAAIPIVDSKREQQIPPCTNGMPRPAVARLARTQHPQPDLMVGVGTIVDEVRDLLLVGEGPTNNALTQLSGRIAGAIPVPDVDVLEPQTAIPTGRHHSRDLVSECVIRRQ